MIRCDRCGYVSRDESLFADLLLDVSVILDDPVDHAVLFDSGRSYQLCPSCLQALEIFLTTV